ncbi:MAG TPA: M20/M25/M40 family metallo-hydrolase [Enhygromyxa sp.]|nr:M20/M25/M40 family metallo-hydrolase [Enhygromyxa sp.]
MSFAAESHALAFVLAVAACAKADHPTESLSVAMIGPSALPEQPHVTPAPPPISADPVVTAIVELAALDSQVDDHLHTLAVEFGPRLTGSSTLANTEQWAVERFQAWGLQATREPWGELPVAFERGKASGQMIRPEREALEFTTWAWTPGTHGQEGLEAGGPVRGQALRYPTTAGELRERSPYLRSAWIMLPWGFDRRQLDATLRKQIDRALDRAPIAGLVWAAGDADDRLIRSHGNHRLDPSKLPTRVEIRLRGDQHAALLERMDAGEYVELEFGVANRLLPGPVAAHNVIAELPGVELPDQRVIVGAHLDSWDGASGAVDNATGVATTMEAARLIAAACEREGVGPRRTISFMLWSGEEQGLLGSKAWVEAHPERLPGISAVLVHDHGTNHISGIAVTPEMWATMQQVFAPVQKLAPETMPFSLRLVEALPWEPSDSSAFMAADVPGFFWDQAGRSDYDRYHHTQHDHADAVIDEYQRHSALVVAIAAWNLASLDSPIDRDNAFGLPSRMIGVVLDERCVVEELVADGVGAIAGLRVGDRIVEVDGLAVADRAALVEAIQRGEPNKIIVVERDSTNPARPTLGEMVALALDWTADPDEPARQQRRDQRRERFGPELRPWDVERQEAVRHD